jgi:hypothetical protein
MLNASARNSRHSIAQSLRYSRSKASHIGVTHRHKRRQAFEWRRRGAFLNAS